MSVIPTTRLGYLRGIRRRKDPYEYEGNTGIEKFISSREPRRMAGDLLRKDELTPRYIPAPYVFGGEIDDLDDLDTYNY